MSQKIQLTSTDRSELNSAQSFSALENVFRNIFGLGAPDNGKALKPTSYKKSQSDYGLKSRGVKTREKINAQVVSILERTESHEDLSDQDRELLLQYSGKGGLSKNSQYEYYTPAFVAEGVWDALKKNGFSSGSILEPSCGAGVFIGTKPEGAVCFGNDLDPVGSKVAALLNPDSVVSNEPFEAVVLSAPDNSFDCAVGNVPFGSARGASANLDPAYKHEKQIERYFLLRMLDKVKPNGLVCVVVPTNIIAKRNKNWERFRIELSKKAEFLGAHKLAGGNGRKDEDVFGGKGGQGTSTTTDVIVLRKHPHTLLQKIEDLASEALWENNVYFSEFIEGRYWQGEGKRFIQGEYSQKKRLNGFDEVVSGGVIEPEAIKAKLAHKFSSRINWDELEATEPRKIMASEGDCRVLGGCQYEFRNGEWQRLVVSPSADTLISQDRFGFESLQELEAELEDNTSLLNLSYIQAENILNEYPTFLTSLQKEAITYAQGQPAALREQLMRGIMLGGLLSRMKSSEDQGEDVGYIRDSLQQRFVAEIDKYGHPANNPRLRNAAADSGLFKMFQLGIDGEGEFSPLLAGTLERAADRVEYNSADPVDVVTYQFVRQGRHELFLDDFQKCYAGTHPITSLGDLACFDGIAIAPDGRVMPMNRYCSGDIFPKIAVLSEAISVENDRRLIDRWQKQIDYMLSRMKKAETEDIVFGLQQNWFDQKYLDEFIRAEGFELGYGKEEEMEVEAYDGTISTQTAFNTDYTGADGEWRYTGSAKKTKNKFEAQLLKVLNGGKIDRLVAPTKLSDSEKKKWKDEKLIEYSNELAALEERFNVWMQQHKDIQDITSEYNQKFNGYIPVQYEPDPLDGMDEFFADGIELHGYQNAEVRRLSEEGRGICGFGVGLGKTFTGLATSAYDHKMGRSKKKCIVVPKSVLENWYHEAKALYQPEFFYNKIKFIGLEAIRDKNGSVTQTPLLDEHGEQVINKAGKAVFQDKLKAKGGNAYIAEQLWEAVQTNPAIVVMSRDWFSKIPLKPSNKDMYVDDMMALLPTEGDKSSYKAEVARTKKEEQFADEGTKKKDSFPYFEDIGFDSVMVDELHEQFKNSLPAGQKTRGIAYLPAAGTAQKARDMAMKGHYLRAMNNGRGIVGLSATPVTNSPFEIFNQLCLVAGTEDFERFGVANVDDFVRIFGKTELMDVMNIKGDVQLKQALSGFKNLDGLRSTFDKFVNLQTAEDVGKEIHVPTPEEVVHDVEMTEEQHELYGSLKRRANILLNAEDILETARMQGEDEFERVQLEIAALQEDSVFSIIRDMDRVATDVDLYRRTITFILPAQKKEAVQELVDSLPQTYKAPVLDEETNKQMRDPETGKLEYREAALEYTILNDDESGVFRLILPDIYEELVVKAMPKFEISELDVTHPLTPKYAAMVANAKTHYAAKGKQLLFTEEKSQHKKLKRLIAHNVGLEPSQIAIINADEASGEKLDKISKNYNAGSHLFVIANKKAEVGVNLQKGTTAIHHMTYPWTPASIKQRNGRGVRQGNTQQSVAVYYYSGKGTFDNYRRMTLLSKSSWMEDLFSGKESSLENADASSREEMIIMVAENPEEMRKKIQQQREEREKERAKKERIQLNNRFMTYANNAHALATNDSRKDVAKKEREEAVQKLKVKLNSQKELGKLDAAERTLVQIDKAQAKLKRVDAEFAAEKERLKRTVAQHKGFLSSKAKEGKLPFSPHLIDHPEDGIANKRGRLYSVGDVYERFYGNSSHGICKIVGIDQEKRSVQLDFLVGNPFRSTSPHITAFDGDLRKCTYSEDELNLKKVLSDGCAYVELPKFLSKEAFALHAEDIKITTARLIETSSGVVFGYWEAGTTLYPEPSDKHFREAALKAYLSFNRGKSRASAESKNLMIELFGDSYEELLMAFQQNASNEKVTVFLQQFIDDLKEEYKVETSVQYLRYHALFKSKVWAEVYELGDNRTDIEEWVEIFFTAQYAKHERLVEDAKAEELRCKEETERERLKAAKNSGTFFSISEEDIHRFSSAGVTIAVNQQSFVSKWKWNSTEYEAFSRIFISGAVTRKVFAGNAENKSRFDAKFLKQWNEHSGAWWHVKKETDLNELLQAILDAE